MAKVKIQLPGLTADGIVYRGGEIVEETPQLSLIKGEVIGGVVWVLEIEKDPAEVERERIAEMKAVESIYPDIPVRKAFEIIEVTNDIEKLQRWKATDTRITIKASITSRLEELGVTEIEEGGDITDEQADAE